MVDYSEPLMMESVSVELAKYTYEHYVVMVFTMAVALASLAVTIKTLVSENYGTEGKYARPISYTLVTLVIILVGVFLYLLHHSNNLYDGKSDRKYSHAMIENWLMIVEKILWS